MASLITLISKEHEDELKKVFDDYDEDGSGNIHVTEMTNIARDLGEELSKEEVDYLIEYLDLTKSGSIGWSSFLNWWKTPF